MQVCPDRTVRFFLFNKFQVGAMKFFKLCQAFLKEAISNALTQHFVKFNNKRLGFAIDVKQAVC